MQRLHPPNCTRMRRHWWSYLQLTFLAALTAAHDDRQAHPALALRDHLRQWQYRPTAAPRAVRRELVPVFVKPRDASQINHKPTVAIQRLIARAGGGSTKPRACVSIAYARCSVTSQPEKSLLKSMVMR